MKVVGEQGAASSEAVRDWKQPKWPPSAAAMCKQTPASYHMGPVSTDALVPRCSKLKHLL